MQHKQKSLQHLYLPSAKLFCMKKKIVQVLLVFILITDSGKVFAWGKTGHELVAQIAFHFLDEPTKNLVQEYLGNLSIEEAANWMDDSKGNAYYNYMRSWHYINLEKGEKYSPSSERNILTILHSAIINLRTYKTIKKKDVKRDLLLIFHLIGDLHQPLHCGYGIDRGGNSIEINSPFVSGNLHSVWDTQILEYKNIKLDSCLELYKTYDEKTIANFNKIDELKWMYQSRSLLDTVYSFQDNFLDERYIDNNATVIKTQLLTAGLRLASVLKEVFAN